MLVLRVIIGAALVGLTTGCPSEIICYESITYDRWIQAPRDEVDVLWVVDDSCSMGEAQQTLADGFVSFVEVLEAAGTDFQVGLITTSFDYNNPERGVLIGDPPFLTADDDYVTLFEERARVGIDGSTTEKGLEAAAFAVSPTMTMAGGLNEGFVRPSAELLVVIVSDGEDCSDQGALKGQPAEACDEERDKLAPVSEFVEGLLSVKGSLVKTQIGAVVGMENGACDDAEPGRRYQEAAALTGGLIGDICTGDWSNLLADLGLNASGIQMSFQTEYLVKAGTLEVTVDEEPVAEDRINGWSYDYDTWYLTFHGDAIPPRGAEITAEYAIQLGGDAPAGS